MARCCAPDTILSVPRPYAQLEVSFREALVVAALPTADFSKYSKHLMRPRLTFL